VFVAISGALVPRVRASRSRARCRRRQHRITRAHGGGDAAALPPAIIDNPHGAARQAAAVLLIGYHSLNWFVLGGTAISALVFWQPW
jgi:hypothetical protein